MTNTYKLLLCLTVFCFFSNNLLGQDDEMKYNLIQVPPSPNSASLGKLAEVSTNLSTGTQLVQIPLISISEGGINLNILLNYQGGGIRVDEESSWIGLGWSLSNGGIITRSVKGIPDDQPNGYLSSCSKVPSRENINLGLLNSDIKFETYQFLNRLSLNLLDFEPDVFYYSLLDINGIFAFNNVLQPVCIPYKPLIIKPFFYGNLISGFHVTDPKGIIYIYGDTTINSQFVEKSIINNEGFDIEPYISSWLLQEIQNPLTKERIKYNYVQHNISNYSNNNVFAKYYDNKLIPWIFNFANQDDSPRNTIIYSRYLNSIDVNGEKIYFKSSIGIDYKVKLDSIIFKDRKIIFNHNHFKVNPNAIDPESLRLKLTSIAQHSNIDSDSIVHKFVYYEYPKLPTKKSYSIDSSGYYNGKNNISAIPKTPLEFDVNYIIGNEPFIYHVVDTIGDADRRPNPYYAKAHSLKKIIYPSGGNTEFLYEGNTIVRQPYVSEIGEFNSIEAEVSDTIGYGYYSDTTILIMDSTLRYTLFMLSTRIEFVDPTEQPRWGAYVQLKNIQLNKIVYSHNFTSDSNNTLPHTIRFHDSLFKSSPTYSLIVRLNRANTATLHATLSYKSYNADELNVLNDYPACGLRIKSIIDSTSNKHETKTYDYTLGGYITNPYKKNAIYGYVKELEYGLELDPIIHIYNNILLYTDPIGGLGTSSNSVSYSKVTEYIGSQEYNTGRTISYFNKVLDQDFSNVALAPHISQQYLRDLIIKQEIFGKDNSLIKRISYQYETDSIHNDLIVCFRSTRIGRLIEMQISEEDYQSSFNYGNYFYHAINKKLIKMHDVTYTMRGDSIVSDKRYFYDDFNIGNISKIIETNSNNNITTTNFKYPTDFIPVKNNCLTLFNSDMHYCYNEYQACETELQSCFEINNIAFNAYKNCIRDIKLKANPSPFEIKELNKKNRQCIENFNTTLTSEYYPCIQAYSCDYLKCKSKAKIDFQLCQLDYKDYLINLYCSTQDDNLKSIYLMALYNCNNILIEKNVICDDELIMSQENQFSILTKDSDTIPVLSKILEKTAITDLQEKASICKADEFSNILQCTLGALTTTNIYSYNNSKYLIAQTINSVVAECAYTGFENQELNGWNQNHPNIFTENESFTGNLSLIVDSLSGPGREFPVGLQANNHSGYQASVWVKGSKNAYLHIEANSWSVHERMSNVEETDGWHLLKVVLYKHQYETLIDSNLIIKVYVGNEGGDIAYFDDLRFYPLDAQMTTYTYEPLIGITSESDNNNKPTSYEYDAFGRLTHIRDFQGNILKKNVYHYKP